MEAREQGEKMLLEAKTIESIWNDTVNTIKISDSKQTYKDYLDKHNLETLPIPEWADQVDMAYFWLQSSINGQLVWEKTKARATWDSVVRLIEKGALFAPPEVEAEDRSTLKDEQLPELEATKASSEVYKCGFKFKNNRVCKREYQTMGRFLTHRKKHGE